MFGSSFDTTLLFSSSHCYYPHRCRQCVSWWAEHNTLHFVIADFKELYIVYLLAEWSCAFVLLTCWVIALQSALYKCTIVSPLFPDLSHDQRPLSAPLYSVYKWSPRESVHRFFLSGASILKYPILIGGRIWFNLKMIIWLMDSADGSLLYQSQEQCWAGFACSKI